MKSSKYLIIFVLLSAIASGGGTPKIPLESRAILSASYPYEATWAPTQKEINQGLECIFKQLQSPKDGNEFEESEFKKIRDHFSSYKVQVIGYEKEHRKLIWFNFIPKETEGWKVSPVIVFDGGFNFWQSVYDPVNRICIEIESNGYAKINHRTRQWSQFLSRYALQS